MAADPTAVEGVALQRAALAEGAFFPVARTLANQTATGFKEAGPHDALSGAQLSARRLFEQLAKRKAESCPDGETYVKGLRTVSDTLMPVLAQLGVHNEVNGRLGRTCRPE